jgi:hypothetical protein
MRRRNPCVDAAVAVLKEGGIHDVTFAPGGKHIQARWSCRGGTRFYALPATPSDWRSPLNVRSDIRKILKADGLITAEPAPAEKPQPPRPPTLEQRVARLEQELAELKALRCAEREA